MKKTSAINVMVTSQTKKALLEKARNLKLTLTGYLEKIALEPVIFADDNLKLFLKNVNIEL